MKNKKINLSIIFVLLLVLVSCGVVEEPTHTHSYYNKCDITCNGCDYIRVAPHDYEFECDTICNFCGEERLTTHSYSYVCDDECNVCGETREVSHTYINECDSICNECGFERAINHKPYSDDFDCTTELLCQICQSVLVEAKNHTFTDGSDTTCNNEGCIYEKNVVHTPSADDFDCTTPVTCTTCGNILISGKENHTFDNNCDSSCNNSGCNYTRETSHTPLQDDHNCTTATKCSVCNVVIVNALSHKFDNSCDEDCNNIGCNYTRETSHKAEEDDYDCTTSQKCSVCNVVLVNSLNHVFSNDNDSTCNNTGCKYSREINDDPSSCSHVDIDNNNTCDKCNKSVSDIIDIFAINDLHGMFMDSSSQVGLDEFSTWYKNLEADDASYELLISQGDMWQGSAESGINKGAMMTEWMNYMGFVSMTLGNHEFDWGEQYVKNNHSIAEFPFLAINIRDKNGNAVPYCQPSTTVEIGNIKIGIIGAIGDCLSSISGEFNGNLQFITGSQLTTLVQNEAKSLRNAGCDFIVYSCHEGYGSFYDDTLSNKNNGKGYVDLVLEGHSHASYIKTDSYGVYHVQSGGYNESIGNITLNYNYVNDTYSISVKQVYSNTYGSSNIKDHTVINSLMNEYFPADNDPSTPENPYTKVLGYNPSVIKSSNLLSIVAQLYLEKGIEKWGNSYDIVVAGGYLNTRDPYDLKAGNITYADLYALLPFDNHIVLGKISGTNLNRKFLQSSSYTVATKSGFSSSSVSTSKTYYIVVDTYTSYYSSNGITQVDIYQEGVYARDLLAEYLSGQSSGGNTGDNPVEPNKTVDIKTVKAGTVGATYQTEGIVVATTKNAYMIMDNSGSGNTPNYIYVYLGSSLNSFNIGDKVSVIGETSTYQGQVQFTTGTTGTLISSNNTISKPTIKTGDGTYLNNLISNGLTVGEYVEIKGTLNISGNYNNVTVSGTTSNVYVSFPQMSYDVSSFNGKTITIKGYMAYIQGSSKKYIYIIPESIE